MGSGATNLKTLTDGATWLLGIRLNVESSRETMADVVMGEALSIHYFGGSSLPEDALNFLLWNCRM